MLKVSRFFSVELPSRTLPLAFPGEVSMPLQSGRVVVALRWKRVLWAGWHICFRSLLLLHRHSTRQSLSLLQTAQHRLQHAAHTKRRCNTHAHSQHTSIIAFPAGQPPPATTRSTHAAPPCSLLSRKAAGFVGPLRHVGLYAFHRSLLHRWPALPASPLQETEDLEQVCRL